MRIDESGRAHPTLGDEVTAAGLAHLDTCPECGGRDFPQSDLTPYHAQLRAAAESLALDLAYRAAEKSDAKAKRSAAVGHWAALLTVGFGACGAWGILTGQTALSPSQGLIAAAAGVVAGMAYRAAGRWEALAHRQRGF